MISMEMLGKIRRMYFRDKLSLHQIAKRTGLSRNTIRKWVRAPEAIQPAYQRCATFNKLSPFHETLEQALKADSFRPKHNRRSAKALFEQIKAEGYDGGYSQLTAFVRSWRGEQGKSLRAFVPLTFALGEAFQFDWSEESLLIGGLFRRIQVSHMKLCASRAFWLVAYPILINNAGIFNPKPFLEVSPEEYDSFLDIILKGKFFMAQAAAKAMQKRGGGVIVQTGSLWAIQAVGATPSAAYSAANAGVHALTRNLALELAGSNIRINTVAPAVVETPVYGTFMDAAQVAKVLPTFNAFHPLGPNGPPADVAQAILFLASDEASWITGTVLPVDGGVTAGRP